MKRNEPQSKSKRDDIYIIFNINMKVRRNISQQPPAITQHVIPTMAVYFPGIYKKFYFF
jgi:hypothetical protein